MSSPNATPRRSILPIANGLLLALLAGACTPSDPPATAAADSVATAPAAPPPYQDLSPAEFADWVGRPDMVLLDVRTPAEIAGGKIAGARELDFRSSDFADRLAEIDTSKTVLVYCASGGRSARACTQLAEQGARRVYNLAGGYRAWAGPREQ